MRDDMRAYGRHTRGGRDRGCPPWRRCRVCWTFTGWAMALGYGLLAFYLLVLALAQR